MKFYITMGIVYILNGLFLFYIGYDLYYKQNKIQTDSFAYRQVTITKPSGCAKNLPNLPIRVGTEVVFSNKITNPIYVYDEHKKYIGKVDKDGFATIPIVYCDKDTVFYVSPKKVKKF